MKTWSVSYILVLVVVSSGLCLQLAAAQEQASAIQSADNPAPALAQYATNPCETTLAEVISVLSKVPYTKTVEDYFKQIRASRLELGAGTVWLFPSSRQAFLEWVEKKTEGQGKQKTVVQKYYHQSLSLPPKITVDSAKLAHAENGLQLLIMAGHHSHNNLWLYAFRLKNRVWEPAPEVFASLPLSVLENTYGSIQWDNNNLVLLISHLTEANGLWLPEPQVSTYKFVLKPSGAVYQVDWRLSNSQSLTLVKAFLQALWQKQPSVAQTLLADPALLSIPKYAGLDKRPQSDLRVIELAAPAGSSRYRLVSSATNDLVVEVGKVKDKTLIKAIFIAPAEKLLQSMFSTLPLLDQAVPQLPNPSVGAHR